jgi:glycosyltransferase involved in cell wall biosynthesis
MNSDVTVIIPTYNSSATLGRALDSVFSQSLLPREVIIIDDGSDDWEKSETIARSHQGDVSVRFIRSEMNSGSSVVRNIGLLTASSQYIAFLDSDDIWFRDKLRLQLGIMDRCNVDLSVHKYIFDMNARKGDADDSYDSRTLSISSLSSWTLLFRNYATPTVMVRKKKMVPFDPCLRRCEDWKCWMEMLSAHGSSGVYIRHALAGGFKPGIGSSGLSGDIKAMHLTKLLALKSLTKDRKISIGEYVIGACIERAKYPARVLRATLRKHAGR